MRKHHPNNVRIKRAYFMYLEQAKRMSPSSVDQVAAAIAQFEESTKFKDFRKFHIEQAIAFKKRLQSYCKPETGRPLAKATIHSRLMALKSFTVWLAGQPGYRARISYSDAEYFNLTANEERIAKAARSRPVPSLDDIRTTIDAMPKQTVLERRDRAVVAFTILSGMRDNAIASLSLKHIDVERRSIFQDAREVRTKRAKTFNSWFFPIGHNFEKIVLDWISEITALGYMPNDPLFPKTKIERSVDRGFKAGGLSKEHWKSADAIRKIFKKGFLSAGLDYYHPHSFRHTLARFLESLPLTPEQWRACSQNFGHSSPMTTFTSYGSVQPHRQEEIINKLADSSHVGVQASLPIVRLHDDQLQHLLAQLRISDGRR